MTKEFETIYLETANAGFPQYIPIEALRTPENYFQIATEPSVDHVGSYKEGDIVRCAWRYFGQGFEGGIVAISHSNNKLPEFSIGDRVRVSEHAGWRKSFFGSIDSGPQSTETRFGTLTSYWVNFEAPQKERSEEDEYIQAQITNLYLDLA